jgi:NDP-sugar pyrophosphorylase family protein
MKRPESRSDVIEETPVVILAGGRGTRLAPVLPGTPKALAPIGESPFLEILLRLLAGKSARRFVLCVGYGAEQIEARLGDGSALGVRIDYSHENPGQLLGTGGALRSAAASFAPRALVLNGDTYLDIDYRRLLERHQEARLQQQALATLALSATMDHDQHGSVLLDEANRLVVGFHEKSWTALDGAFVNAGAYVIERDLLEYAPHGQACSLERQVFPAALADGRALAAAIFTEAFFDIGTPDGWSSFTRRYLALAENATHALSDERQL